MALFCARKTVQSNWLNWQDEYLVPHASAKDSPLNAEYEQWVNDSIVYSLFNSKSNQSSLRDVKYKGKTWQIRNNFFFMSPAEMKSLADKAGFDEMYQDAKQGEESYVLKLLSTVSLSDDARAVLEAARGLVRESMGMRKSWHENKPELHLQAWDAGWAQIKPMLKEEYKGAYGQFVTTYRALENRMRLGVKKYGFLK